MLCLKKMYNDELLQLTLILSLLRVYPESYFDTDPYIGGERYDFGNGTSWGMFAPTITRFNNVNPKSLDVILLNYEREVFADLNSLGRYNRINNIRNRNITAYLLNIDCGDNGCNINSTESNSQDDRIINEERNIEDEASVIIRPESDLPTTAPIDLTQEDMDLIEILWKQDVDLGFSLDVATEKFPKTGDEFDTKKSIESSASTIPEDDIEKLKALEALNSNSLKTEDTSSEDPNVLGDIWSGLYTIDTETGEYILKGGLDEDCLGECNSPLPIEDLPLPECFLEEALNLVGLDDEPQDIEAASKNSFCSSSSASSSSGSTSERSVCSGVEGGSGVGGAEPDLAPVDLDSDSEFSLLDDMIQTQFHPPPRHFQGRVPFMRTMSIEQRWQDLANLLSIPAPGDGGGGGSAVMSPHHPFPHHAHHPALHTYNHTHGLGYPHDTTRSVLLHNATLNPPVGDLNATTPYSNIGTSSNLGSAVATSMNLANSTEPMADPSCAHYKIDTPHDMLYYPQNTTNEMNQTTEGFLSSILDEDLQLMDLAMTTEGMYPVRVLDNNASSISSMVNSTSGAMGRLETEKMDTSSDSALSSMGSERVSSLSDGEWCDAGSDSGHTPADMYMADYNSKYRPYDYSYSNRTQSLNSLDSSERSRIAPVAQKKHQMFGKRYFQEQGTSALNQPPPTPIKYEYGNPSLSTFSTNQARQAEGVANNKTSEIKYSCTVEFARQLQGSRNAVEHVQHNHTYHLPAECTGAMQRPVSRDKAKSRKSDEEHLTRDEKRARALNVPLPVHEIINLPMDEFNERLSKYDLNEAQLTLIRDIRRRGKNKVAAQNCRKRKLDQILSLADEVRDVRDRKHRLIAERDFMLSERQRIKDKFAQLYRHIFENLRDPDGNHYSPYQYSLQQSADGSVLVVPRANTTEQDTHKEPHQNCKK